MKIKPVSQERIFRVLLSPVISEKSQNIGEKYNQIAFKVASDATKTEIKAAVEQLFEVQVSAVRVVNIRGKAKRFGRFVGKRANLRKAYVSLAEGQELNYLAEGA